MPSTAGLRKFIRKGPPTDVEWLELIEARRALIKPLLDSITLPTLGDLECLKSESHRHKLSIDGPVNTPGTYSINVQGIFRQQPHEAVVRYTDKGYQHWRERWWVNDGSFQVWGLTRSGVWVLALVEYRGEEGYKGRGYERATRVSIIESDIGALIAATQEKPRVIWNTLGETIKKWAERREQQYREAMNLSALIQVEETALAISEEAGDEAAEGEDLTLRT